MKKVIIAGLACLAVLAVGGIIAFRTLTARGAPSEAPIEVSQKAARSLQAKIDAVRNAEHDPHHKAGAHLELSEGELESYLLYSLKDDIPAKVDTAEVRLGHDTISLDTQITFASNPTGNPVADALVGGTHNLFVKGQLVGQKNRGKFDLMEVRVDSIPVPTILIHTLVKRYVKPKYPEADLNEPFDLPWGIEQLKLEPGRATVVY